MTPELHEILELIVQHDVLLTDLPRNVYGDVNFDKMRIRINPRQTVVQRVDTLLHEAVHVYYFERGIDVSEERVIRETSKLIKRLYGGRKQIS